MNKNAFKSKTMWFNFLTGVIAASLGFFPSLQPAQAWLADPAHLAITGVIWSFAGMALRMVTKGKLVLVE